MDFLERIDVKKRLIMVLSIAFLCMVALSGLSLNNLRQAEMDAHRERIKSLIEVAKGVTDDYIKLAAEGKISTAQAQQQALDRIRAMRYDNGNYYFIYNADGRALMIAGSPKLEGQIMLGKADAKGFRLWDAIVGVGQRQQAAYLEYWFPRAGSDIPLPKIAYVVPVPEWHWTIGTGIYIDDVNEAVFQQATRYGIGLLLALLITGCVGLIVSSGIIRQLGGEPAQLMAIMQRAANGNLSVDFDLKEDTSSVLANLKSMLDGLGNLAREIRSASAELARSTRNVAGATTQVLEMAGNEAEGTSAMAAAMQEMTVSVSHIAENARDTEANSRQSADHAAQGRQQAMTTVAKIQQLAQSAQGASESVNGMVKRAEDIGNITAVIKEIADQTNLLALNAAIEAARAGESGRGFAVVADEVRKLAERTARSTIEIAQMVQSMRQETGASVELLNQSAAQAREGVALTQVTASVLGEIHSALQLTLEHVQDVAGSTHEQSVVSTSIARQVERIANLVEETRGEMDKAARETANLERLSQSLEKSVERFHF